MTTNLLEKYFKKFGENQKPMAASPQALICCEKIIKIAKTKSILDSGSGLSSVFFHSKFNNVLTVDHNAFWADKTASFISANLNKNIKIEPITAINNQYFDFIFYDYGDIETRIYYFKRALEMCKKLFYVDDMHINYYREYVQTKSKAHRLQFLPQTVDEYGRYGALIVK